MPCQVWHLMSSLSTNIFSLIPRCSGVRSLQRLFSLIETQKTRLHYNWQLRKDMSSENLLNLTHISMFHFITLFPLMLSAYWRHSKRVLMERGRPYHHCGIVSWRQIGGIKWSLISSMQPHVARWLLWNALLPVGMNLTSGTCTMLTYTSFMVTVANIIPICRLL